ncbi:MAG: serine hydrolase domain-containing protein [Saprospiraceae bacterium]
MQITLKWFVTCSLVLSFFSFKETIVLPESTEERINLIENRLEQLAARQEFHGAIVIKQNDEILLEKAYGQSTDGIENIVAAPFKIASIGKMFTGVAIMQLVEQGKLNLEDNINQHLPNYGNAADASRITIEHLLTHSSGITDIFSIDNIDKIDESQIDTWRDYFVYFENEKLEFKPGKKFSYSNSGYFVLGAIVEAVTGADYCDFVSENIFEKAAMQVIDCGTPTGGAEMSMHELLVFTDALLQNQLLNRANTELATTGKTKIDKDTKYAYGFEENFVYNSREISQKGGSAELKGQVIMYPETGITIVIYANNNDAGYDGFNEIRGLIREALS